MEVEVEVDDDEDGDDGDGDGHLPPPPPPPNPANPLSSSPSSAPYRTHPPASSQTCIEWKGSETAARSKNAGSLPPFLPPPPALPSRHAPARRSAWTDAGVRVETRRPGMAGRGSSGSGLGLASASATRRWRVAGLWAVVWRCVERRLESERNTREIALSPPSPSKRKARRHSKKLTELPGEGEADHPSADDGDVERVVLVVVEMRRGQGRRGGREGATTTTRRVDDAASQSVVAVVVGVCVGIEKECCCPATCCVPGSSRRSKSSSNRRRRQ